MSFSIFVKTIALAIASALIYFAVYGTDFLSLAKALAFAIGLSLVITLFYPHIRGIRKGDRISVINNNVPFLFGLGRTGFALMDGSLNKEIRIKFDDGKEAIGIIESYEGIFSPPKIRLLYEEKIVE